MPQVFVMATWVDVLFPVFLRKKNTSAKPPAWAQTLLCISVSRDGSMGPKVAAGRSELGGRGSTWGVLLLVWREA